MVEGQGSRKSFRGEYAGFPGVVMGLGNSFGRSQKDGGNRMFPRVAVGSGVGMELAEESDLERSLLAGLADGRFFKCLSVLDKPAGDGPSGRRMSALDQNDARPAFVIFDFNDDVDGRDGIPIARHLVLCFRTHFIRLSVSIQSN